MAYRAAAGSGHACRGVIVLGGDVPPELESRDLGHFPPVLLGRGTQRGVVRRRQDGARRRAPARPGDRRPPLRLRGRARVDERIPRRRRAVPARGVPAGFVGRTGEEILTGDLGEGKANKKGARLASALQIQSATATTTCRRRLGGVGTHRRGRGHVGTHAHAGVRGAHRAHAGVRGHRARGGLGAHRRRSRGVGRGRGGLLDSVSSFLQPANGTSRIASRQRSER